MEIKKLIKETFFVGLVYACISTSLLELFVIISRTSWDDFVRNNTHLVFAYCFVVAAIMKPATKKIRSIMFGN
jgi:hypothetical protein